MTEAHEVPHSRKNAVAFFERFVADYRETLKDKKVFDLSAGSGYIIALFERAGAHVRLFDLFPEQNTFASSGCEKIDLQEKFPIGNATADIVICAETIEHLPNQFFFFSEVARILRPGGRLILTTPNTSSLRSRFSQFIMESEHYSAPAPNELNAFTRWGDGGYFGKLFISGLLRLRTMAALNQLRIEKIHPSPRSSTSYWLLPFFYPWLYYFSKKALRRQLHDDDANKKTYEEIFRTNLSMDVLLGKHLILEFQKQAGD